MNATTGEHYLLHGWGDDEVAARLLMHRSGEVDGPGVGAQRADMPLGVPDATGPVGDPGALASVRDIVRGAPFPVYGPGAPEFVLRSLFREWSRLTTQVGFLFDWLPARGTGAFFVQSTDPWTQSIHRLAGGDAREGLSPAAPYQLFRLVGGDARVIAAINQPGRTELQVEVGGTPFAGQILYWTIDDGLARFHLEGERCVLDGVVRGTGFDQLVDALRDLRALKDEPELLQRYQEHRDRSLDALGKST